MTDTDRPLGLRARLRRLLPPYLKSHWDVIICGIDFSDPSNNKRGWIKAFAHFVHSRLLTPADNAYYFVRYRTFDKYHVVRLRTEPGYRDIDDRIFHACFALLGEFVEEELGRAEPDDEDQHRGYRLDSIHSAAAIDLWLWYVHDLPRLRSACADTLYPDGITLGGGASGPSTNVESRMKQTSGLPAHYLTDTEERKLSELMVIRRSLWT